MLDSHSALRFNGYIVDSIKFEVNKECKLQSVPLKVDFKRNMSQIGDKYFVSISVSIFNENLSVDSPFYLFISLTGEFQFTDNADVDNEFMIDINAVAILFPYLRSAVTNITSTANIPPLILPTINVSKLLL